MFTLRPSESLDILDTDLSSRVMAGGTRLRNSILSDL